MITIVQGDCLDRLRELPDCSVHCVVTSPPYWNLRDYGVPGQVGLERTIDEYVAKLVEGFREVRRVLRKDGTLWCNLGDSFCSIGHKKSHSGFGTSTLAGGEQKHSPLRRENNGPGLKHKDLCGIPWRVAFALQADGWWLRQDIIWAKPGPMPESVRDRCTKSHEYIFLLTKSATYFYDVDAIKEPVVCLDNVGRERNGRNMNGVRGSDRTSTGGSFARNKRSVWTVPSAPYPEAHFATYPPDLIKSCILAGTSARGACPKCGAPWERVVDSKSVIDPRPMTTGLAKKTALGDMARTTPQGRTCGGVITATLGWRPTCKCGQSQTVPCTVLDPFAGSGTTGY